MGEELAPKCEKCGKQLWNHSYTPDREVCECNNKLFKPGILEKAIMDEQWPVKLWCKDRAMGLPECATQCHNCEYELSKTLSQFKPAEPVYTEADLRKVFKKGWLKAHNKEDLDSDTCWQQYKQQLENKCFECDGTGKAHPSGNKKTGEIPCAKCNGTGKE